MQLNSYTAEQFSQKYGKHYTCKLKSADEKIARNLTSFILSYNFGKTQIMDFFEKFFAGELKHVFNFEITEHLGNIRTDIIYFSEEDREDRGVFYDLKNLKNYVCSDLIDNMNKIFNNNTLSKMSAFIYGKEKVEKLQRQINSLNQVSILNYINFEIKETDKNNEFVFPSEIEKKIFSKNNVIYKLGKSRLQYELYDFYVNEHNDITAVLEIIPDHELKNSYRFIGITYKKQTGELYYNNELFTFDEGLFKKSITDKINRLNKEVADLEKQSNL